MAPPIVYKLATAPIASHCFSPVDNTTLAIATGNIVQLFNTKTNQLIYTLEGEHDKPITAVDISIHGRIVTCSQDRNAIVWEPLSDGSYKPTLVLLRINRSATCVSWAHNGYKFAVGSGARTVAICYYEQENDWWISKHIKKGLLSTVECVNWHDNDVLLAVGGTDGVARVYSGFIKGLDSKDAVAGSSWGDKFPFGGLVREFPYVGSWIHDIKFFSENMVAYVAHNGGLYIANSAGQQTVAYSQSLPFKSVTWLNESELVVAGFDCQPELYAYDGSVKFVKNLDTIVPVRVATPGDDEEDSISALSKFKQLDLKGKLEAQEETGTHSNTIVEVRKHGNGVSTCGLDGRVAIFAI